MDQLFVSGEGVAEIAMFAQPIPMIGNDDGEGVFFMRTAVNRRKNLPQIRILIRHLCIVHIAQHPPFQLA